MQDLGPLRRKGPRQDPPRCLPRHRYPRRRFDRREDLWETRRRRGGDRRRKRGRRGKVVGVGIAVVVVVRPLWRAAVSAASQVLRLLLHPLGLL